MNQQSINRTASQPVSLWTLPADGLQHERPTTDTGETNLAKPTLATPPTENGKAVQSKFGQFESSLNQFENKFRPSLLRPILDLVSTKFGQSLDQLKPNWDQG